MFDIKTLFTLRGVVHGMMEAPFAATKAAINNGNIRKNIKNKEFGKLINNLSDCMPKAAAESIKTHKDLGIAAGKIIKEERCKERNGKITVRLGWSSFEVLSDYKTIKGEIKRAKDVPTNIAIIENSPKLLENVGGWHIYVRGKHII